MKKILTAFLFITAIFSQSAFAGELEMRNTIFEESKNLFLYEEFNKLEEISQLYLMRKSRTPSGIWRLTILFNSLQGISDRIDSEERWRNILEKNEKWLFKYPDSSAALITKGNILISYAWQMRGARLAHEVPEESWPKFRSALIAAQKYMLSIKSKADHNPEWYVSMINISKGLDENVLDFKNLLKEALNKHPDYYEIYFAASERLQPKWGGSLQKMENLANYAIDKTKKAEGMGVYVRYYWYVYQFESPTIKEEFFKHYNVDWAKMKQGMYDIIKTYPDQWNINNFARFACIAQDKETTKDLIAKVQEHIMQVWGTEFVLENCKRWANSLPVEMPQDDNLLSRMRSELNQWFDQLSYAFKAEDFEVHRNNIDHFYEHRLSSEYKRDVKIKYTSVCDKNDGTSELLDKVQSFIQTREEFLNSEKSLTFQKRYNAYEHTLSNFSYNEDLNVYSILYNLKLAGYLEEIGGFAGSEIKAYNFDEFRECSANFVYTEDNQYKMTKENCEILVQKGCPQEPEKKSVQ